MKKNTITKFAIIVNAKTFKVYLIYNILKLYMHVTKQINTKIV